VSELPGGWVNVAIEDVITPRSDRVSPRTLPNAQFIGMEHVEPNTNRIIMTVQASTMASNAARFLAGDVLYGRMRPYLNKVVAPSFDGLASAEFIVFPQSDAIDGRFLLRRLSASDFTEFACSQYEGDRPRVKFDQLGKFKLLLPPRREQSRIVEKLEELLSDLDAGVAELKAAQRKLMQYRQSLLKAAVDGTLTADWRAARLASLSPRVRRAGRTGVREAPATWSANSRHPLPIPSPGMREGVEAETGAELLQRILAERRSRWEQKQLARFAEQGKTPPKGWQSKYPEPVAPDTDGLPELPEGWVWARLGQLLDSLTSGSRDWAPYYGRGNCTFVMAQNVRPWRPDFSFRQLVDPPLNDRDRLRSKIAMDDILVTIVGANTGQTCRVDLELEDHFVCQSVALLRPTESSMSEYINAVLNSEEHGQKQLRDMNYGAGRPHLSFDQLESVLLPLPPLSEQQAIIAALEDRSRKISIVDEDIHQAHRQAAAQRKNLLRAAFAGQLVSQDPGDEPASELLARIRASRDAERAGVAPRRGRRSKTRA
jgi:type I restriction enzyme, S subunit